MSDKNIVCALKLKLNITRPDASLTVMKCSLSPVANDNVIFPGWGYGVWRVEQQQFPSLMKTC